MIRRRCAREPSAIYRVPVTGSRAQVQFIGLGFELSGGADHHVRIVAQRRFIGFVSPIRCAPTQQVRLFYVECAHDTKTGMPPIRSRMDCGHTGAMSGANKPAFRMMNERFMFVIP
jgi:hypothetical protein